MIQACLPWLAAGRDLSCCKIQHSAFLFSPLVMSLFSAAWSQRRLREVNIVVSLSGQLNSWGKSLPASSWKLERSCGFSFGPVLQNNSRLDLVRSVGYCFWLCNWSQDFGLGLKARQNLGVGVAIWEPYNLKCQASNQGTYMQSRSSNAVEACPCSNVYYEHMSLKNLGTRHLCCVWFAFRTVGWNTQNLYMFSY